MDWKNALKKALKTARKFLRAPGALEASLAQSARDNNLKRAEELIADGAQLNYRSYRSDNALDVAIELGHVDMVMLLLKAGADPNSHAQYSSTTPFLAAAGKGNVEIVAALLDAKAAVNTQGDRGNTALTLAVAAKNKPLIRLLLDKGANVDLRNRDGWNPLFFATRNGDAETVGQLLEKGARTDYTDTDDRGLLDVARQWDRPAVFKKIQDHLDAQVPEWQVTKDGQLAHVSILRAQGYKLTEVFNFETKQCTVISHNFETGRDMPVQKSFAELGEETVKVATAKLAAQKPVPQPVAQP